MKKFTIIGGGNIGSSIAMGIIKSGFFKKEEVVVSEKKAARIEFLQSKNIETTTDNIEAVKNTEVLLIAIKPNETENLLNEIKVHLKTNKHILLSVVTGFNLHKIKELIGNDIPAFRVMPNTAIAIQQSMTCIASDNGNDEQKEYVKTIFDQLGKAFIIDEKLINASTVLGACGIAFALRFIRAASQGGIEIGFDANIAQQIAVQTVKGAAALLVDKKHHPEHEIDKVTTPQGCTIAGLNEMEHQGFSSALIKGIITSYNKI